MKYLLLIFLSILSINTFAAGGGFGGGGAGGSWDEPKCEGGKFQSLYSSLTYENMNSSCDQPFPGKSFSYAKIGSTGSQVLCYFTDNKTNASDIFQINTVIDKCEIKCPEGYEKDANGKCQPKKCPVGQSLVNGQCKPKQCPVGQMLDAKGNCMPPDDQCPAGQTMVNGRCTPDPTKPDDPDSEPVKLPPFCEWAAEMCQWHKEWQQWSNDYNANEEKANLDREELKRLALDSKEELTDINQNTKDQLKKLDDLKIPLEKIKEQDQVFYDEVRLWLNNFDPNDGTPSQQNPSIEFPKFCDWSVQICNWYLNWKDWRTDYNANNVRLNELFEQHLERLQEMKEQDKDHYDESKSFFKDAREFFDWYKDQEQQEQPTEPEQPSQPAEPTPPEPDEQQRVSWQAACPVSQTQTITMDGQTTTLQGFDMTESCSMAAKMRPLILLAGALISLLIIARGHS